MQRKVKAVDTDEDSLPAFSHKRRTIIFRKEEKAQKTEMKGRRHRLVLFN